MMQIHPCDGFSSPNHIKLHQIDVFYCCCMHSRRVAWISSQHQLPNDILHACVFKKNNKFSGTYKKVRPNKVSRVWFGNLSKAAVLLGMVECPPCRLWHERHIFLSHIIRYSSQPSSVHVHHHPGAGSPSDCVTSFVIPNYPISTGLNAPLALVPCVNLNSITPNGIFLYLNVHSRGDPNKV